MARWTQYIGLSKEAIKFLNDNKYFEIGKWKMTSGICGEEVFGRIYEVHVEEQEPYHTYGIRTYAEVEDVTPWSSGPMIHTALRNLQTGNIEFHWKDEDIHYD